MEDKRLNMRQETWQEINYRKELEAENALKYGEKAQLSLLHDIFALVFHIQHYIENATKDINLTKMLMAMHFRENLTQADIARDYGIPGGTLGNIIAQHTVPKATEETALITMIPDPNNKRRRILKLTSTGEKQAKQMLFFMDNVLNNMKEMDKKSPSVKYDYLQSICNQVHKLCRYTTGKEDILNTISKNKKFDSWEIEDEY